jgi:hypothetical protein
MHGHGFGVAEDHPTFLRSGRSFRKPYLNPDFDPPKLITRVRYHARRGAGHFGIQPAYL